MKNHKIANTQQRLKLEKKHRYGIRRILEKIEVCLNKFKNNQILLSKISHRFIPTTKLFTR